MVKIHPQSYDPPPPPPPQPRPLRLLIGRRGIKDCCCFLFQLCFCLGTVCSFLLLLLVVIWAIAFGIRRELQVHVSDAYLACFDLLKTTQNDTVLAYDMSLNISLTNPNSRIGVYYDTLAALASYGDKGFAAMALAPFYQGHKMTNTLRAVFEGNKTVSFGSSSDEPELFSQFEYEKRSGGVYSITVALALSVGNKYGTIKYRKNPPYIYCFLQIPLNKAKPIYVFRSTLCVNVHVISYDNT